MLDKNSDIWDAFDVQEVGLGRGAGEIKEEPEIPEFDDDSEDEDRADAIDMHVDILSANA